MEKEAQDYLSEPDLWSGLKLREAGLRNVRNELRRSGLSGEYRESLEQSFEKINEDISLFETALGSYLPHMTKRRANTHKERRSKSLRNRGKMSILVSSFQRVYSLAGGDARTRVLRLTALALALAILFLPVTEDEPALHLDWKIGVYDFNSEPSHVGFRSIFLIAARNSYDHDHSESIVHAEKHLAARGTSIPRLRPVLFVDLFVTKSRKKARFYFDSVPRPRRK